MFGDFDNKMINRTHFYLIFLMMLRTKILVIAMIAILGAISSCSGDGDLDFYDVKTDDEEESQGGDDSTDDNDSVPTWESLIGDHPRATNREEQIELRQKVDNGEIDASGPHIEVPNDVIEKTSIGTRAVMSDNDMRWHNPLSSMVTNPEKYTRWYQKDGNTQVFRVYPGDENWQSAREGAARSEAFAPSLGIRRDDGKVMTFSARYRVAEHNGSKDVKLFQSKATMEGGYDPAWCLALHVTAAGDIDIIKRGVTWDQNERISTGFSVGESFNFRVTDDGFNYKVFVNDELKASGSYERKNLKSVCRWGAYVQGGSEGVLTGDLDNPEVIYVSGARVTLETSETKNIN